MEKDLKFLDPKNHRISKISKVTHYDLMKRNIFIVNLFSTIKIRMIAKNRAQNIEIVPNGRR